MNFFVILYCFFKTITYTAMTSVQTANTRHTDTAGRPWRLLLLISCMLTVWINARGAYPIVRNFNEKNVGGGTQTWDICQDSLGNMYFANKFGLIRFDSRNWTPYAIGNESEVRSLCYDSTRGRIYAGGSDEFGYFVHDPSTHRQRYVSLSRHLSSGRRVFGEVWNIFNDRGNVWFQADHSLYRHDGRTLQVFRVQDKITASALIGENIYIGCANGRISMLRAGRMTRVHAPMLEGERIVAILPNKLRRNILIVTEYSGIYTMDERGINRMPTAVDDFMRDNQTFCATINDNTLAVGTVNMGLVIIDLTDGSLTFANKLTGMQNNTVLTLNYSLYPYATVHWNDLWKWDDFCFERDIAWYRQSELKNRSLAAGEVLTLQLPPSDVRYPITVSTGNESSVEVTFLKSIRFPGYATEKDPDIRSETKTWTLGVNSTLAVSDTIGVEYDLGYTYWELKVTAKSASTVTVTIGNPQFL